MVQEERKLGRNLIVNFNHVPICYTSVLQSERIMADTVGEDILLKTKAME